MTAASQAWQTARRECHKRDHALDTMVEAIHIARVGPKVIDGWATLTDAQHDAFDALVEPLADELLGGPAERTDAIASICAPGPERGRSRTRAEPNVRIKITYSENSTVRVTGIYADGADYHVTNWFYMMLVLERPRRPDETWSRYARDTRKRAKPSGLDDRRWHYYGDIENGLVDARLPPAYGELRARLGGGDYDKAMAYLRATP